MDPSSNHFHLNEEINRSEEISITLHQKNSDTGHLSAGSRKYYKNILMRNKDHVKPVLKYTSLPELREITQNRCNFKMKRTSSDGFKLCRVPMPHNEHRCLKLDDHRHLSGESLTSDDLEPVVPDFINPGCERKPHPLWRIIMIFMNLLLLMCGVSISIVGICTSIDSNLMSRIMGSNLYLNLVYFMIFVGFFTSALATIGCVGALKQVRGLILMHMFLTVAAFLTLVIGGSILNVYEDWVRKAFEGHLKNLIHAYENDQVVRNAWDSTQQHYKCCGVNSWRDWRTDIPDSCCEQFECSKRRYFLRGCLKPATMFIKEHLLFVYAVYIAIVSVFLFAMYTSWEYLIELILPPQRQQINNV